MKIIILICLLLSCSAFGSVPCGLSGSIEERIQDCSLNEDSAKWGFILVTRMKNLEEIWKNQKSRLIWSDPLSDYMNQPDAIKACQNFEAAGIPKGSWRLPEIDERSIPMPISILSYDRHSWFWSSTDYRDSYLEFSWYFYIGGYADYSSRKYLGSVRCVTP